MRQAGDRVDHKKLSANRVESCVQVAANHAEREVPRLHPLTPQERAQLHRKQNRNNSLFINELSAISCIINAFSKNHG
jgi:hypothetical protein